MQNKEASKETAWLFEGTVVSSKRIKEGST